MVALEQITRCGKFKICSEALAPKMDLEQIRGKNMNTKEKTLELHLMEPTPECSDDDEQCTEPSIPVRVHAT